MTRAAESRLAGEADATAPFFIGTAGWSLSGPCAADFPPGPSHLARYAALLNAAEINSSFYRPHRRSTYERWAAAVPEAFRFSVKLPRAITHDARLTDCEAALDRFTGEVDGLSDKLGVLLVQLPPSLAFDETVAVAFFAALRSRCGASIACEPRHATWFTPQVDRHLAAWRIARVAADPALASGAGEPGGWTGLVYRRLHGSPRIYYSDYSADTIDAIAETIQASMVPSWCIFDNTAAFHALGNALALSRQITRGRDRCGGA